MFNSSTGISERKSLEERVKNIAIDDSPDICNGSFIDRHHP
ncbi:MAG TPA: hypothetical protein VFS31_14695 [Chitinophagaceae bacterium]|nr:hypothetical protein [Chitinophagaceae bacterium]